MRVLVRISMVAALALLAGCGGKGARVPLVFPPLSAVVLSVTADTLAVGFPTAFSATAYDLASQPVSGVPFQWTSSNSAVFTVNSAGVVTGQSEGRAELYAEAGGQRDTADILVLPTTSGWFNQTSNSSSQLNDVFFRSNGRQGCVVGNGGELLLTWNAGETWDTQWDSGTVFSLNAVWFTSDSVGWAVGGNGTTLRTQTGGRTWTPVVVGSSDNLMDVQFTDAMNGWIVGSNGVVLTTSNGGGSWLKQNPTGSTLNGVSFAGNDGWAVGTGGVILGSHDAGLTWFTYTPAVTATTLNAVWRRTASVGFAAGFSGLAPRTFFAVVPDSTEWELRNAGASLNFNDVMYVSNSRGWLVGDQGGGIVRRSVDGGTSWDIQSAPSGNALRAVYFVDDLRGWAVGDNGRILHTGTGGD